MGAMILKLDAENQALRRQDCFIFFMQTAAPALLPQLLVEAKQWHQSVQEKKKAPSEEVDFKPLRTHLVQTMADMLLERVTKMSKTTTQDPLWTTAVQNGLITPEGHFPFQRWHTQTQQLCVTKQQAIPLPRMLKYLEQLQENTKDPSAVMKFHALKQPEGQTSVPWIMQVAIRHDELFMLMTTLQGSTVWGLLRSTMKPHSLTTSKQGSQLRELLGKGNGKHQKTQTPKGKGKTKTQG